MIVDLLTDLHIRERREHRIFQVLLQMVPGLEARLMEGSDQDTVHVAELVSWFLLYLNIHYSWKSFEQIQKGASSARSDDTKSLKAAVLDWITPRGQPLNPPLSRNVKSDRGFHHERTGALLCPGGLDWSNSEYVPSALSSLCTIHSPTSSRIKEKLRSGEMAVSGDQWPIFVYQGYSYDPEDPWNGLLRSTILVSVSLLIFSDWIISDPMYLQSYKHVFTSPSSVEKEPKATRSGNARLHGMTRVTSASIAYVATQVIFLYLRCGF